MNRIHTAVLRCDCVQLPAEIDEDVKRNFTEEGSVVTLFTNKVTGGGIVAVMSKNSHPWKTVSNDSSLLLEA